MTDDQAKFIKSIDNITRRALSNFYRIDIHPNYYEHSKINTKIIRKDAQFLSRYNDGEADDMPTSMFLHDVGYYDHNDMAHELYRGTYKPAPNNSFSHSADEFILEYPKYKDVKQHYQSKYWKYIKHTKSVSQQKALVHKKIRLAKIRARRGIER